MSARSSPQPLVVGEASQKSFDHVPNEMKKQSYAASVQPKQSTLDKIELCPVIYDNGDPIIQFTMEEINIFTKEEGLHQAVVVKFSYGRPDLGTERRMFSSIFDVHGHYNIGLLDFRHLLIRFDLYDDYVRFLSKTTGVLKSKGVEFFFRTFPWTFSFNPKEETPMAVVWISLPGLPPNLFAKKSLMSIAAAIGKPLAIDKATQDRSRPSAARVKVIVDLLKKHPKKVTLQILDSVTGKTVDLHQQIVFDNLPKYCVCCKHQGHFLAECRFSSKKPGLKEGSDDNLIKLQGDAREFLNKIREEKCAKELSLKEQNAEIVTVEQQHTDRPSVIVNTQLDNPGFSGNVQPKSLDSSVPLKSTPPMLPAVQSTTDPKGISLGTMQMNNMKPTDNCVKMDVASTHLESTNSLITNDLVTSVVNDENHVGLIDSSQCNPTVPLTRTPESEADLISEDLPRLKYEDVQPSSRQVAFSVCQKDNAITDKIRPTMLPINAQVSIVAEKKNDDRPSHLESSVSLTHSEKVIDLNLPDNEITVEQSKLDFASVQLDLTKAHVSNEVVIYDDSHANQISSSQLEFPDPLARIIESDTNIIPKVQPCLNAEDVQPKLAHCATSLSQNDNATTDMVRSSFLPPIAQSHIVSEKKDLVSATTSTNHNDAMLNQIESTTVSLTHSEKVLISNLSDKEVAAEQLKLVVAPDQFDEAKIHVTNDLIVSDEDLAELNSEHLSPVSQKDVIIKPGSTQQNSVDQIKEMDGLFGKEQRSAFAYKAHTNQLFETNEQHKTMAAVNSKSQGVKAGKTNSAPAQFKNAKSHIQPNFQSSTITSNHRGNERNNMGLNSCHDQTSSQKSETKNASHDKDTSLQTGSNLKSISDHKVPKRAKSSKPKLWKDQGDFDDEETWGEGLASFSWEEEDQGSGEDNEDSIEQKIDRKIAEKNTRAKANQTASSNRRLNHNAPVYVPANNAKAFRSFEGTSMVISNDCQLNSAEISVDDRFATQQPSTNFQMNQNLSIDINTADLSQTKQLVTAVSEISSEEKQSCTGSHLFEEGEEEDCINQCRANASIKGDLSPMHSAKTKKPHQRERSWDGNMVELRKPPMRIAKQKQAAQSNIPKSNRMKNK